MLDIDTVARLGGDEFAVLLCGADQLRAEHVAARILDALHDPIALPDTPATAIHASVGIALAADRHQPPDDLLLHADQAMYQAKIGGKDHYRTLHANREPQPAEATSA